MFANTGAMRNLKHEGYIEDFYNILNDEAIGEGASATVFKGIKKDNGETYAIKIIDMSSLGETELENLHNELKIMSIIDHPNIVRVYEYFECHNIVFIVMEYMSGGELFDRIVEYEHYTEKQAAEAFGPIVDAVRYCHKLGIAHRDLKPENLLYQTEDENSVLKVSDFGLAKFFIPKTEEKLFTACGTPSYVAPEIIASGGYDYKVDCWSLGVILYVMLCGFPPFYSDDNSQLFNLIRNSQYEFPSPWWDSVSEEAKDLIRKLLVVDSSKRLDTDGILKHPWLTKKKHKAQALPFKEDYIEFKKKSKLKTTINAMLIINLWKKITFGKKDK
ncbi:MAG: serine/threonine-protein kinase [archaeon]|nr:serine/threonine-protein kinase [archaeon]